MKSVKDQIKDDFKQIDKKSNRALLKDVLIWGTLGAVSALVLWYVL